MINLILKIPFNILSNLYSVIVSLYENFFLKQKIAIDKKIQEIDSECVLDPRENGKFFHN